MLNSDMSSPVAPLPLLLSSPTAPLLGVGRRGLGLGLSPEESTKSGTGELSSLAGIGVSWLEEGGPGPTAEDWGDEEGGADEGGGVGLGFVNRKSITMSSWLDWVAEMAAAISERSNPMPG